MSKLIDNFKIQDTEFSGWNHAAQGSTLKIISSPRPYSANFVRNSENFAWLLSEIQNASNPLVIVDKFIFESSLQNEISSGIPVFPIDAIEPNKDIKTVLAICDFFNNSNATKNSMVFVIGGGIVQDLGAYACAMFKRGIPWTYIPTTLLSQSDSCIGGKTAVNHNQTKNILALFSSPRSVQIDINFLKSLSELDYLSGGGEIFKLLLTGGERGLQKFEDNVDGFLKRDQNAILDLISASLSIKKLVIEHDEFELDIRRSMNYGHSIGHAFESLSKYKIPHGVGVTMGVFVENRISLNRGLLNIKEEARIMKAGLRLIPKSMMSILKNLEIEKVLPFLSKDKKVEGSMLKLSTLSAIGFMKFIDLPMDQSGLSEVILATREVVNSVQNEF